jgi:hypothetical protein
VNLNRNVSIPIMNVFRREILQTGLFLASNSVEVVLSHSYLAVGLLLIYGTMWWLNMRFDARLFVMSYSLLSYVRNSCTNNFNLALRDLVNYVAAQKRIRVISRFCKILCFQRHPVEIFVT